VEIPTSEEIVASGLEFFREFPPDPRAEADAEADRNETPDDDDY
jgi:hypothetical protein